MIWSPKAMNEKPKKRPSIPPSSATLRCTIRKVVFQMQQHLLVVTPVVSGQLVKISDLPLIYIKLPAYLQCTFLLAYQWVSNVDLVGLMGFVTLVGLVALVGLVVLVGLVDVLTVLVCSACSPDNTSITIICRFYCLAIASTELCELVLISMH